MASPPRVLILTLSFGSGHVRAAAAVADELRRASPAAVVDVVDVLAGSSVGFRAVYVWPYWAMLRFAPFVWRRLFASRLNRVTRHTAPVALFRIGCRSTFERIRTFQPDVIVAAEVGACEIAVAARRLGITGAAIVAAITDATAEPAWVAPEVCRYAVPSDGVAAQLADWGARRSAITTTGIAIGREFAAAGVLRTAIGDAQPPRVLLMGGGMGPTRMDSVAAALMASEFAMEVLAVTGRDVVAARRLKRVKPGPRSTIRVLGWTNDVPQLMRSAAVLVSKPGGLTIAEASASGLPLVIFDPIPGPEEANAAGAVAAGAAVLAENSGAAARVTIELLENPRRRQDMAAAARQVARPGAAADIAAIVLEVARSRPTVLLTISNGAGHMRAAEAVAACLRRVRVEVLDVADYFSPALRFTHVTAYLWIVRHLPRIWGVIDRMQKQRPATSPSWYYRRGARRLFRSLAAMNPAALAATEVGCCEIAALIKRDVRLTCALVAVNAEYDADRAWVQPEVSAFAVADESVAAAFAAYGADPSRIRVVGVPLHAEFTTDITADRHRTRRELGISAGRPVVLVAGGSEALGRPEAIADVLLARLADIHVILLTGRSATRHRRAARRLARHGDRITVFGWTSRVADLMAAADVLVSKLGHTFDEALARQLPIVALPPPPGAERVQYGLLRDWGVGCAVETVAEAVSAVATLTDDSDRLSAMRAAARGRTRPQAAAGIARELLTGPALLARGEHPTVPEPVPAMSEVRA